MSPFILLPNCLFTSSFLLRMHLLAFLFSSLYNSKHLSFETSSFAFSTFNQASFLLLTACITSLFHHSLLTFLPVSYTHLRAHETPEHLVCRLLLEKKKKP